MNGKPFTKPEVPGSMPLPREGAFVLQLGESSRLDSGMLCGRVEHVASGRAGSFGSVEEMLAFVLDTLRRTPAFSAARAEPVVERDDERRTTCERNR